MIFDTHIHLNDAKLINNLDEYIEAAHKLSINKFLCVGWDIESSKKAIEIAHKYPGVYAAVAVMPTEWKQYNQNTINELRDLAKDHSVVAIGEIGLDYYWEKTDEIKAIQKEMFVKEIELANELNLPISIHCRDAYQDCLNILKTFHVKRKSIMHCYSGSYEMSKEFIKENFVLAFGGTLTYKNSKNNQDVFDKTDIKNIVFETDAPYLSPQKYRGQVNKPEYIYQTVLFAANRKNIDIEALEKVTFETSEKIFSRENNEK
jgi:TatD DNase family protein